jgi:hypothetical protein
MSDSIPPVDTPYQRPVMGMPSQDERTQAMLCWVLSIVATFVAPLIFFLISNDKPFVKKHAAICLGFQIATAVISVVLFVTIVGALLVPVVGIFGLVVCIMAAMAANRGEEYMPPVVGPMIAKMFGYTS